uniref:Uncharacterized protein n=1 Tax=Oryza brachyantha TaxID=4533 RepID=J3MYI6_ORYBR
MQNPSKRLRKRIMARTQSRNGQGILALLLLVHDPRHERAPDAVPPAGAVRPDQPPEHVLPRQERPFLCPERDGELQLLPDRRELEPRARPPRHQHAVGLHDRCLVRRRRGANVPHPPRDGAPAAGR